MRITINRRKEEQAPIIKSGQEKAAKSCYSKNSGYCHCTISRAQRPAISEEEEEEASEHFFPIRAPARKVWQSSDNNIQQSSTVSPSH
ncbi:hypothetical protein TYRP_002962 [Tyrophagus putrescentiae]|nr:hypothetical protein TYRP_002962 [Tyrophagus putrescentiae]